MTFIKYQEQVFVTIILDPWLGYVVSGCIQFFQIMALIHFLYIDLIDDLDMNLILYSWISLFYLQHDNLKRRSEEVHSANSKIISD